MIVGGIDIGSLSTKSLILENGEIIRGWSITLTGPDPIESASAVINSAIGEANLSMADVKYLVATGYGRVNVPFAQASVTEISCHARGCNWLFPSVRTVLDMGGQDCKAIRCDEKGNVIAFAMNDKCAAGTGRYLERVAGVLNLGLDQIGPLSLQGVNKPVLITNTCVVFAEEDIIRAIREGNNAVDILAGAIDAIVDRVAALLERVGVEGDLCISGGVAKNKGVVARLQKRFGLKPVIAPEPQIVGALGAALIAADMAVR
jgi:predicted CoA-substrate-specific enzyme activase